MKSQQLDAEEVGFSACCGGELGGGYVETGVPESSLVASKKENLRS